MPEASALQPEAEFLTVAEASRLLGVDARQIRRWVERLDDSDKSSDTSRKYRGVPIVTVRMSALKALQAGGLEPSSEETPQESNSDIETGQQLGKKERPVRTSQPKIDPASQRPNSSEAGLREIIERQDAEIKRLANALAASQQIASQAQQLQLLAERRLSEVEGKSLPAVEQKEAHGTPGGDSGGSVAREGESIPSTSQGRMWWQFWRR